MVTAQLNHVSVCADNLEESIRFYRELFGLEPIPTPNFGFPVQWLRIGSLQLHLFERPGEAPVYHHVGLSVASTDEFEAIYHKAKELGIHDSTTFGHHLYELPGRNGQMYVRDPAGNLVEIDCPDVTGLSDEVKADMRKLADQRPQSEENLRATLFLD